jgi:hypothetical protein
MKLLIQKGATSKSVDIFVQDSSVTTGAGLAGLVFNSAGLVAYQHRPGSAAAAITLATLASATAAWSSGGFIAVDGTNMPGVYRFDIPDAVLASGVNECVIMLRGATNMAPVVLEIQLVSFDPNDAVRAGLTALPNAAAAASGGLFTRGTGAGQINQDANGRIDVNVAAISTDSVAADNCELMFDGTGYAGGTTPLSVNLTQWRGTQPAVLVSTRVDASVGAMANDVVTAAAIATDAIGASELSAAAANKIRDAVDDSVIETEGSVTRQQAESIALAVLAGRTTDSGNTFRTPNNVASRVAATTNGSNERTAITLTPSA